MIEDNTGYQDMNQGIDRITDILRRQSTPVASSPIASQASQIPANILNALAASSYSFGNNRGGDFMTSVQNYQTNQQNQELNQQKMLLNAYDAKLKMGDAQAKALDDKLTLFTGNDPDGKALFLEALHNDPEQIDPSNSYQLMTKLAGIKKKIGYESPDLKSQNQMQQLDLEAKTLGIMKTKAEINKINTSAVNGVGGGDDPAALKIADAYQKAREAGDTKRMQDIILFTKSLEKGQTLNADGNVVNMTGAPEATRVTSFSDSEGKTQGKLTAEAQANLPKVIDNAETATSIINKALTSKGMAKNFGLDGLIPNMPGGDAANASALLDQIQGGGFLSAIETLKGTGQITELEGTKGTDAIVRMSRAQSFEAFQDAADDYTQVINRGVRRARKMASGEVFDAGFKYPEGKATTDIKPPTPEEEAEYMRSRAK
jgi:hypothetical protein